MTHHDYPGQTVGITFRLDDSVPARLLRAYAAVMKRARAAETESEVEARIRSHMEKYLAKGKGSGILRNPLVAAIVEEVLHAGDPADYALLAWVIMPNHVHAVIRRTLHSTLPEIVRRWKGRSAHGINELLCRRGALWCRDYYDRDIAVVTLPRFRGLVDYEVSRAV